MVLLYIVHRSILLPFTIGERLQMKNILQKALLIACLSLSFLSHVACVNAGRGLKHSEVAIPKTANKKKGKGKDKSRLMRSVKAPIKRARRDSSKRRQKVKTSRRRRRTTWLESSETEIAQPCSSLHNVDDQPQKIAPPKKGKVQQKKSTSPRIAGIDINKLTNSIEFKFGTLVILCLFLLWYLLRLWKQNQAQKLQILELQYQREYRPEAQPQKEQAAPSPDLPITLHVNVNVENNPTNNNIAIPVNVNNIDTAQTGTNNVNPGISRWFDTSKENSERLDT